MTTLSRRAPAALVLVTSAALLSGCAKPPAPLNKAAAPDVIVEMPVVHGVRDFEDFTGRTEGFKVVDIRPEVTGKLKAVHFKDGDFVSAGAPLFDIDPALYAPAVKRAAADLDKAKADISNWEAQIELAKAELKRATRAAESSAAAQTDVDKAIATLDVNRAQLKAALAAREAAEAALETANVQLGYTKITAPYTGRISRRMVDPGNIVKANETVLTRLVVLDPIYVAFDIDERSVLMFRRMLAAGKITSSRDARLDVLIGLADEEGYTKPAHLIFADNQLDLNTGTLRFRAEMENPPLQFGPLPSLVGSAAAVGAEQKGLKLLSPGMFVRVRMPVGREHPGVLIPEEALGNDQGHRFVYVIDNEGKAVYRRVTLGPPEGKMRVIDSGVAAGERVVVSGHQRVRAGAKVNAKLKGQKSEDRSQTASNLPAAGKK